MRRLLFALFCLTPLAGFVMAAAQAPRTLDFYTIDVEGGKSVLVVSPSGESMLFDAGWPRAANRDASTEQIVDVVKRAGLRQIDYLVLSHFDVDHLGDVPALVSRVPIRHLVDHGEIQFPSAPAIAQSSAAPTGSGRSFRARSLQCVHGAARIDRP